MSELTKKLKPSLPYVSALLGGALMPFAFSPYNLGVVSIFSCMVLLWCIANRPPKQAAWIGWLFGVGMFGIGVNWVYVSIHDHGNASPWLATLITTLFIFGLALLPALMTWLLNRFFKKEGIIRTCLIFPVLWVAFEIFRGWFLTGFPWLFIGYTQLGTHLRSFAPLGSVWAVSWVTVLVASLFYNIIRYYYFRYENAKLRNGLFLAMFIIWISAFGLNKIEWSLPTRSTLHVALIQGNVPQLMRWDPSAIQYILETYQALSQKALDTDLIIWPEGAVPVPLPLSLRFFQQMDETMKGYHIGLITGVPTELSNKIQYYNSVIGVGEANGLYHKSHLVPFGEYVPLEKYLRGLIDFFNLPMSSFISGTSPQSLLTIKGYRIAPAICYEIAYPLFVQAISQHADIILTISNDAWFGTSIGPFQHLQMAQLRALETGKYVMRATNTGITAIIEPNGSIQAAAPQFEPAILKGEVHLMVGKTPWLRFGIWPLLTLFILIFGLGCWLQNRERH